MIPASSSSLARSLPSVSVIRRWLISQSATTPQLTHLSNRSVLEIAGPDAQKFLKGLTSRDVENLGGGYSGILNASVGPSSTPLLTLGSRFTYSLHPSS